MNYAPILEAMKVLIVDDERLSRTILSRFVAKRFPFCDVMEAENGLEGLERVNQDSPDAIFLDLRMPIMNGIEMLEALRNDPFHTETPVIITSAIQEKSVVMRLTQLGIEGYLLKPIDIDGAYIRIGKMLLSIRDQKGKPKLPKITNLSVEKYHKILLVDDDPTFRMFFASMIGNRCEVLMADDGSEAYRVAQENELITDVCISENLAEGNGLQNRKFLAKKLRELKRERPIEILICSERDKLNEDEKPFFQGIIRRTFVQKLFIESLLKKIFKDDSKEGTFRHVVANQFGEKIQAALVTELPSFITENVAILDDKVANIVSNEHSESISVYVREGKIDISIGIDGMMLHFEQLARLRGDSNYKATSNTNQIFQETLNAITTIFLEILKKFNYSAKVNTESWKKQKEDNRRVQIYSIPFRFGSGEEFVCRVWFNDVS
ncbi:MAG: response regulator [Ignavibacteriae bacterium]|nr:response regulator [Ignavibacteriota bacterium]